MKRGGLRKRYGYAKWKWKITKQPLKVQSVKKTWWQMWLEGMGEGRP
jgi:hypothetical protein